MKKTLTTAAAIAVAALALAPTAASAEPPQGGCHASPGGHESGNCNPELIVSQGSPVIEIEGHQCFGHTVALDIDGYAGPQDAWPDMVTATYTGDEIEGGSFYETFALAGFQGYGLSHIVINAQCIDDQGGVVTEFNGFDYTSVSLKV